MKIIINGCYGGFSINKKSLKELNIEPTIDMRTNPEFIKAIESGKYTNNYCSKLVVEEIPDNVTDYSIEEYDGLESIIYVVDGKLHWA